jgi:hypothetical protein
VRQPSLPISNCAITVLKQEGPCRSEGVASVHAAIIHACTVLLGSLFPASPAPGRNLPICACPTTSPPCPLALRHEHSPLSVTSGLRDSDPSETEPTTRTVEKSKPANKSKWCDRCTEGTGCTRYRESAVFTLKRSEGRRTSVVLLFVFCA